VEEDGAAYMMDDLVRTSSYIMLRSSRGRSERWPMVNGGLRVNSEGCDVGKGRKVVIGNVLLCTCESLRVYFLLLIKEEEQDPAAAPPWFYHGSLLIGSSYGWCRQFMVRTCSTL
jgi:hypothetical protein